MKLKIYLKALRLLALLSSMSFYACSVTDFLPDEFSETSVKISDGDYTCKLRDFEESQAVDNGVVNSLVMNASKSGNEFSGAYNTHYQMKLFKGDQYSNGVEENFLKFEGTLFIEPMPFSDGDHFLWEGERDIIELDSTIASVTDTMGFEVKSESSNDFRLRIPGFGNYSEGTWIDCIKD